MKEGTITIQQNLQPMSQEVFLVTRGDYSEYRVCAVFSEKALAKKYVDEKLDGKPTPDARLSELGFK